jgi:hypothetical protein
MNRQPPAKGPLITPNRVVAFLGPYVAIGSGVIAAWLGRHFPGLGIKADGTAKTIASAVEFGIGAFTTWALHHKWLTGWQQWEQAVVAGGGAPEVGGAASIPEPVPAAPARPAPQPEPAMVIEDPPAQHPASVIEDPFAPG